GSRSRRTLGGATSARKPHGANSHNAGEPARTAILKHGRRSAQLCGLAIEPALGEVGEEHVGGILPVDGLLEQPRGLGAAGLIGRRDQGGIARYLVMLDRLCVGDHAGVKDNWLLGLSPKFRRTAPVNGLWTIAIASYLWRD